jgi:hypothetical protein
MLLWATYPLQIFLLVLLG